jgi:hypothetical protein
MPIHRMIFETGKSFDPLSAVRNNAAKEVRERFVCRVKGSSFIKNVGVLVVHNSCEWETEHT